MFSPAGALAGTRGRGYCPGMTEDGRHTTPGAAGQRVAWWSSGTGPPIVLVNGYAATSEDWDPSFVAALEASFEVVRPDNRGLGGSELGDPAAVTIDAMAADVEAVLDALGIDRVPVVGWSMGGFIAQQLAVRSPGRVTALVLLATDPGGPAALTAAPEVWDRLTDRSGSPRQQASRLISLLFPPSLAPEIDRQFGDLVAGARAGLDPAALDAQEAAMGAWHDEGGSVPVPGGLPVLAVSGTEDVVIPPGNAEALAARWPGGRVVHIDGGGHAFMAQDPVGVAGLVTSFLGR